MVDAEDLGAPIYLYGRSEEKERATERHHKAAAPSLQSAAVD